MRCLPPRILFAMAVAAVPTGLRIAHSALRCHWATILIAAVVFLLSDVSMAHVKSHLVWLFVLIGSRIAFLLEWRYAQRSAFVAVRIANGAFPAVPFVLRRDEHP